MSLGQKIEQATQDLAAARKAGDQAGASTLTKSLDDLWARKRAARAQQASGTADEIRRRARIEAEISRSES